MCVHTRNLLIYIEMCVYIFISHLCVIPCSGTAPEERSYSSPSSKIAQLCPDQEKETGMQEPSGMVQQESKGGSQ